MKQPEALIKLQDKFLKELNILANLPEETKYDQYRHKIHVSYDTYTTMKWLATEYTNKMIDAICDAYRNGEISTPHINFNKHWAYDVIDNYYNY